MTGCHVQPEQMFNLIYGFYDQQSEEVVNLNAAAGDNVLDGVAVPDDEYWVLMAASAVNLNHAPGSIRVAIQGTFTNYIFYVTSTAAARWESWSGFVLMAPGDKVRAVFTTVTLGDVIYLRYLAAKMKWQQ